MKLNIMNVMKRNLIVVALLMNLLNMMADGLLVSEDEAYPGEYLRNKSTNVEIQVQGLLAKTVVTQEFENEWDRPVKAVYSFPLPMNARSTRLMYSIGDTMIDAVLRVQAQAQNPGTGSGGVVAEINKYMGKNVIRLKLNNIMSKGLKQVRLSYVQKLDHYNGIVKYCYPLNASDFVKQPLDYFRYHINIHSSQIINGFEVTSHPGYKVHELTDSTIIASNILPKTYAAKDLTFKYFTENEDLSLDFFSWKPEDDNGYFTAVGHSEVSSDLSPLNHKVIFLLCNSSTMAGIKLEQSKLAIADYLEKLSERDSFILATYNSSYSFWSWEFVPATEQNIEEAKSYLEKIKVSYGNVMDGVLTNILNYKIKNSYGLSSILVFTDGKSVVDPYMISEHNKVQTGIFPVAIGNDFDKSRLELLASMNYGFVTYIQEDENLSDQLSEVFDKISHPLYKSVNIDVLNMVTSDIYPLKFPAIYGNSDFMFSGRYQLGGLGTINIEAYRNLVLQQFPFEVRFAENYMQSETARYFWAKNAIDHLEAEILINGETDSLKEKLIDLSLKHNMRCRYTAYIVDSVYEGRTDDVWGEEIIGSGIEPVETASLITVFPTPANENSMVRLCVSGKYEGQYGMLKVFDINGRLIGCVKVLFNGDEFIDFRMKDILSTMISGNCIVSLEVNGTILGLKKITLQ